MTTQPDIILLVLDTQRADRLGVYGHRAAVTPHLDNFASQAALFEQAIAPAQWTIPSHASLFTGLYPTAHQVTQSNQSLGPDLHHMAEVLDAAGYETVGFCNNPLVGILNNGFKRGFQTFYNYGGAIPSLPRSSSSLPPPLNRLGEAYTQFLRRISYPVQNFFGQSDLAFRLSLNAWFTPLWSKMANFKGQNERSVKDLVHFLQQREKQAHAKPLFLFINLMETHLPFWPPGEFIDRLLPYFRSSKEARTVMRTWNRAAYRWAAPLAEPLSELESRVLNDMYDAEVAYQDHYLGDLFAALTGRERQQNTLTIITGDHGDALGDHQQMGHAFVAYQELVQVPLIMHWPQHIPAGVRLDTPVSTRRIYHTVLDAAGHLPNHLPRLNPAEVHQLTLLQNIQGNDPENGTAYAEVYPPLNLVKAIAQREPELLRSFRSGSLRRALVRHDLKLIQVDNRPEELFHLPDDPTELHNVLASRPGESAQLNRELNRISNQVERQREQMTAGDIIDLDADENLQQRLRSLGYIE